jgi:hypothetical protein
MVRGLRSSEDLSEAGSMAAAGEFRVQAVLPSLADHSKNGRSSTNRGIGSQKQTLLLTISIDGSYKAVVSQHSEFLVVTTRVMSLGRHIAFKFPDIGTVIF